MIGRVMIVVAAGSSVRFGGDKLMSEVAGVPLVAHTVSAVIDHVDRCILVCREDQVAALARLDLGVALVPGGPSRTASEMAGLAALGDPAVLIGVHDGARPLVPGALIDHLFETAARVGGAVPVVEPALPLVRKSDLTPVSRAWVAQTPQVFRGEQLLAAYVAAAKMGYEAQDTAEIAQRFGSLVIVAVPGEPGNIKVTEPGDLELIRSGLGTSRSEPR
ncbi:MAG TPA: 2-C-methyl-D-erythritol 4-phosphate cytidylyltransferase [Acidimicrobiia bacterium]|nr:2-C-methyl-D-erythritol 4-phosphate cytidylyltransferase [Acidimicrobiia bacterium]